MSDCLDYPLIDLVEEGWAVTEVVVVSEEVGGAPVVPDYEDCG